jgi:ER-bound oxygenase mpaB/B'/Rubber oxygenase, catalytic domain
MSRWSNEFLESMRQEMDPVADECVKGLFEDFGLGTVADLHGQLVDEEGKPREGLPEAMARYLEETAKPPDFPWVSAEESTRMLETAEAVLNSHGILQFILLSCASLPECYVDRLGMPVLFLTQKLNKDITRRVVETARYVVDVMSTDGFMATGHGLDSARKVRLMHAATRYLILNSTDARLADGLPAGVAEVFRDNEWKEEMGMPINQEDLAYTLQTFAWVTVRGFRDLWAGLEPHEEEAIIHVWNIAGHHMGIRHDLLPHNVEEAEQLFDQVKARVQGESVEGKSLTAAVMDFAESNFHTEFFKSSPRVLTRHLVGDETADMLGLPENSMLDEFNEKRWIAELSVIVHFREARLDRFPGARDLAEKAFQWIVGDKIREKSEEDGKVPFTIPESLAPNWAVNTMD